MRVLLIEGDAMIGEAVQDGWGPRWTWDFPPRLANAG